MIAAIVATDERSNAVNAEHATPIAPGRFPRASRVSADTRRARITTRLAGALLFVATSTLAADHCGDVDCSGTVQAKDALVVLKTAVGIDAGAKCTCPATTTTTTLAPDCSSVDVPGFTEALAAARCVAYAPSGNWNPNQGKYPSSKSVAEDLELLRDTGFDCLVTYGADHVLAEVPCMAKDAGFTLVVMGVWNPTSTEERAGALLATDCADAYLVGNEGLTIPYDFGLAYTWNGLVSAMADLRAETCRPVSTSEPSQAYFDGVAGHGAAEVRALGDWISPNAHPYFAGHSEPIDAVAWTVERYQLLVAMSPGRLVQLKEVGLPTAGDTGLDESGQEAYYEALRKTGTRFAAFEAFDQNWKTWRPVEPHWGIFENDRTPKKAAGVFGGG